MNKDKTNRYTLHATPDSFFDGVDRRKKQSSNFNNQHYFHHNAVFAAQPTDLTANNQSRVPTKPPRRQNENLSNFASNFSFDNLAPVDIRIKSP